MSTLQVANIHLESTGNNRIQLATTNTVAVVAGSANVVVGNTSVTQLIGGGANVVVGNSTVSQLIAGGANAIVANTTRLSLDQTTGFNNTYVIKSNTMVAGNNHTINCASGNYFVVVANSSTQNINFSSVPTSVAYSVTIRMSNGAGGNTLGWPTAVRWPSGTAPSPSTNNDVYVLFTDDGGTNWRGIQSQRDSR
jgi:hypothetical protein